MTVTSLSVCKRQWPHALHPKKWILCKANNIQPDYRERTGGHYWRGNWNILGFGHLYRCFENILQAVFFNIWGRHLLELGCTASHLGTFKTLPQKEHTSVMYMKELHCNSVPTRFALYFVWFYSNRTYFWGSGLNHRKFKLHLLHTLLLYDLLPSCILSLYT